jgi:hypothetical protein
VTGEECVGASQALLNLSIALGLIFAVIPGSGMDLWKGQTRMLTTDFIGRPFVGQSIQGDLNDVRL